MKNKIESEKTYDQWKSKSYADNMMKKAEIIQEGKVTLELRINVSDIHPMEKRKRPTGLLYT